MVLSSPSGGGKTSIAKRLQAVCPNVIHSVSATTRAVRPGEVEGQSYWFQSRAEFERDVAAGEFLEWAEYGGNLYGTLRREVERGRSAGKHVVLDIEVQGASQLRRNVPDAVHVFVLPPSGEELVRRLEGRQTETPATIAKRLTIASGELSMAGQYDYVVINDDLERATAEVAEIIAVECRRPSRLPGLRQFVGAIRDTVERSKPQVHE